MAQKKSEVNNINNLNNLPPPKQLETTGSSPAEAWLKWKAKFTNYLEATNMLKETQERKMAIMLHVIGDEAQELTDTFVYHNEQGESITQGITLQMLIDKFDEFYIPKKNITYERRKFLTTMQKDNQSIEDYVAELRKTIKTCEYGQFAEDFIKDQLVGGIKDDQVRERLLRVHDLNLNKALEICRATEVAKQRITIFTKTEAVNMSVEALHQQLTRRVNTQRRRESEPPTRYQKDRNQRSINWRESEPTTNRHQRDRKKRGINCSRCGIQHEPQQCPA